MSVMLPLSTHQRCGKRQWPVNCGLLRGVMPERRDIGSNGNADRLVYVVHRTDKEGSRYLMLRGTGFVDLT